MDKFDSFWLTFMFSEKTYALFNEKITFCRLPAEVMSTFVSENRVRYGN